MWSLLSLIEVKFKKKKNHITKITTCYHVWRIYIDVSHLSTVKNFYLILRHFSYRLFSTSWLNAKQYWCFSVLRLHHRYIHTHTLIWLIISNLMVWRKWKKVDYCTLSCVIISDSWIWHDRWFRTLNNAWDFFFPWSGLWPHDFNHMIVSVRTGIKKGKY